MISPLLERLRTDDFHFSIGFHHSPAAVRRSLLMSQDVRHVAAALRFGAITQSMISDFVSTVMSDFSRGCRLPNDLALAAIAIVLELRPTAFAEEYLHDLARLELTEMRISISVARECLKNKCSVPKHQAKSFTFPSNERPPIQPRMQMPQRVRLSRRVRLIVSTRRVSRYSECVETS
jgi:hypothetical protein